MGNSLHHKDNVKHLLILLIVILMMCTSFAQIPPQVIQWMQMASVRASGGAFSPSSVAGLVAWYRADSLTATVSATGGIKTTNGDYIVHSFTNSGTFAVSSGGAVEYLIVGGGGGAEAAGGGAGGFLSNLGSPTNITAGTYSIAIGAGGTYLKQGTNSSAFGLVAVGDGYGAAENNDGGSGGSGGGGSQGNITHHIGGSGTAGQGTNGGNATNNSASAGGGGAGGVGGASKAIRTGGDGGVGLSSAISGTAVYYAGGGAAGGNISGGTGGLGGGGGGNTGGGVAGTPNTGGGGGGGDASHGSRGGSGIVIIRYLSGVP